MNRITVKIDGQTFEVALGNPSWRESSFFAEVNGEQVRVIIPNQEASLDELDWIVVGNRPYEINFDANLRRVKVGNQRFPVEIRVNGGGQLRPVSGDGRVKAPIPGLIRRVMVRLGDTVQHGQSMFVLEAMKMENEIQAPRGGIVTSLNVSAGKNVSFGEILAEIS